jgi:hypothetical protein
MKVRTIEEERYNLKAVVAAGRQHGGVPTKLTLPATPSRRQLLTDLVQVSDQFQGQVLVEEKGLFRKTFQVQLVGSSEDVFDALDAAAMKGPPAPGRYPPTTKLTSRLGTNTTRRTCLPTSAALIRSSDSAAARTSASAACAGTRTSPRSFPLTCTA